MSPFNYANLRRYDNQHFKISHLGSALFFPRDIEGFEADHPEIFPQAPLAQARGRIAELERQLQELRQENESLKAGGGEVESASANCENCPSNQSAEQRLGAFKMGVRMALRCAADGSEQSKEGHLALWRELHGVKAGKPNSRYFDAFRAVLDEVPYLKCPDPRQK